MNDNFLNELKAAQEKGVFADFIRDTAESGILFEAMPQLRGLHQIPQDPRWHPEGDVWIHTLLVLKNLPANATFAMSLAALLHDVGKAAATVILDSGAIKAHGHEEISAQMAHDILSKLGASDELQKEVVFLVRHHMKAHSHDTKAKTLRRLILEGGRDLVDQLLQHGVADVAGGCRDFTACERIRHLLNHLEEKPEKPSVVLTGNEIMELTGFKSGPDVGKVFRSLSALGAIDRDTAIKFVKDLKL
ncbi:MAG TPA: HD domain-containing protein [Parachlamydiaceae bacterium]|nr:HD domain-containing protein [Parachlamydiaceae bacterium]